MYVLKQVEMVFKGRVQVHFDNLAPTQKMDLRDSDGGDGGGSGSFLLVGVHTFAEGN